MRIIDLQVYIRLFHIIIMFIIFSYRTVHIDKIRQTDNYAVLSGLDHVPIQYLQAK